GGGMRVSGALEISTSAIYDNTAEAQGALQDAIANGGGCYTVYGDIHITDSTISANHLRGNAAERRGGGLFTVGGLAPDEDVVIAGSTLDDNTADKGGGLFDKAGKLNIVDSTISGNRADTAGGAVYALGSPYGAHAWKLGSSTITRNSAGNGGGIVDNHDPDLGDSEFQSSIVADNINTLAGTTYDADIGSAYSGVTVIGANNLIVAANGITLPLDTLDAAPLLGPLQDNGGLTRTHALLAGSPAIDSGNNAENLDFDQRGKGFARIVGVSADIGAFEAQIDDTVFKNGFDGAGVDPL
ncbi:MAG TPA: choice-of-anchor Q domain-containing protein, partial [Casimicrobiaceae bacterium]|nr:choice-of-anchor Q domain-containing protein [Casimicrobiaceae bacterium]